MQRRHLFALDKLVANLKVSELSRGARAKRFEGSEHLIEFRVGGGARVLASYVKDSDGEGYTWVLHHFFPGHKLQQTASDRVILQRTKAALALHSTQSGGGGGGGGGKGNSAAAASVEERPDIGAPAQATFYHGRVLITSENQDKILADQISQFEGASDQDASCIQLVAGPPGSGKSLGALRFIEGFSRPVIYIAESRPLRQQMKKEWNQSTQFGAKKVCFLSYCELLRKMGLLPEGASLVGDDDLKSYFEVKKSRAENIRKAATASSGGGGGKEHAAPLRDVTFDHFLQECRVMPETLDKYLQASINDSLFAKQPEIQRQLWQILVDYRKKLEKENKYHLGLSVPKGEPNAINAVVIVDEVCDYSRHNVNTLADNLKRVLFFGDGNQALRDSSGSMVNLEYVVKSKGGQVYQLPGSFRCADDVLVVATELLGMMPELGSMSRRQAASLAGLAPRANDSGQFKGYRHTAPGRNQVKPMLFMAAMAARNSNSRLKTFYNQLVARGKSKVVALVALMRKIIVIASARLKETFNQPNNLLPET